MAVDGFYDYLELQDKDNLICDDTETTETTAREKLLQSDLRRNKRVGVGVGLLCAVLALLIIAVPLYLYQSNMVERAQLVTSYNQLQARTNNLTEERDQLQTGFNQLQNRHSNLTQQNNQLQASFDQMQTSFDQLQSRHNQLTAQKDQLQASFNQLQTSVDKLQTGLDPLQTSFDQLQTRHNQLTEEKDQLQTSFDQLQTRHNQLTQQNHELRTSFDKLQTGSEGLQTIFDDLQASFVQLQAKHNNLTEQEDQLRTSFDKLQSSSDQLQTSFDQLQSISSSPAVRLLDLKTRLCESAGWQKFNGSCYYISTWKKTWDESREWCKDRQSDLIVINSEDKQDFVERANQRVWLGLTDREGSFQWVDGTPLTTPTYWRRHEPTHNGHCVEFYDGSMAAYPQRGWDDKPCAANFQWICEFSLTV